MDIWIIKGDWSEGVDRITCNRPCIDSCVYVLHSGSPSLKLLVWPCVSFADWPSYSYNWLHDLNRYTCVISTICWSCYMYDTCVLSCMSSIQCRFCSEVEVRRTSLRMQLNVRLLFWWNSSTCGCSVLRLYICTCMCRYMVCVDYLTLSKHLC